MRQGEVIEIFMDGEFLAERKIVKATGYCVVDDKGEKWHHGGNRYPAKNYVASRTLHWCEPKRVRYLTSEQRLIQRRLSEFLIFTNKGQEELPAETGSILEQLARILWPSLYP